MFYPYMNFLIGFTQIWPRETDKEKERKFSKMANVEFKCLSQLANEGVEAVGLMHQNVIRLMKSEVITSNDTVSLTERVTCWSCVVMQSCYCNLEQLICDSENPWNKGPNLWNPHEVIKQLVTSYAEVDCLTDIFHRDIKVRYIVFLLNIY